MLKKQTKSRVNLTHALLDFYDEQFELAEWCEKNVIVLSPDTLQRKRAQGTDLRQVFVVDPLYYQGSKTPVILRLMHARLRH